MTSVPREKSKPSLLYKAAGFFAIGSLFLGFIQEAILLNNDAFHTQTAERQNLLQLRGSELYVSDAQWWLNWVSSYGSVGLIFLLIGIHKFQSRGRP